MKPKNHQDDAFEQWAARVKRDLLPKMQGSAVVVSIVPEIVDAKFAVELGISIMLDKPIIAVVRPGSKIPEKLARVVDRFVEWNDDAEAISQAISEMLEELGLIQ